ncbi:MAG: transposase [Chloroflexota bacterium]
MIISQIDTLPESFKEHIEDPAEQQAVLDELLEWLNGQTKWMREGHPLVRIKERFDLSEMVEACQGFHIHEMGKPGQEATYSIEQLSRALLVKRFYGWSYEKTAQELASQGPVPWFVVLAPYETTISATTLWRFEQWVQKKQPRILFNTILKQIDEDFPEEREKMQAGDTYAMVSVVNAQSRSELLRTSCQNLLDAIESAMPVVHSMLMPIIDKEAIFGKEKAPKEAWLTIEERKALEVQTALAAANFLLQVERALNGINLSSAVTYADIVLWQSVLDKVLSDEFMLIEDDSAQSPKRQFKEAKLLTKAQREKRRQERGGTYRYGSTKELEATFRNHGKSNDFGCNISIAATENFIREIAAATGATPDATGIPLMLEAQIENLGTLPPKFVYDRAAGFPIYFHQVDKVTDGQTQLVAHLIETGKKKEKELYGPKDFTLDENGVLTCPAGEQTSHAYRSSTSDGWDFRFPAKTCQGCPLLEKCRPDTKPTTRRSVFISDYRYFQWEAIAYAQTDEFKVDMKFRAHIERIIAALVRYNGGRRATSKGLEAADYQARMAATAYNLKRWLKLTDE